MSFTFKPAAVIKSIRPIFITSMAMSQNPRILPKAFGLPGSNTSVDEFGPLYQKLPDTRSGFPIHYPRRLIPTDYSFEER